MWPKRYDSWWLISLDVAPLGTHEAWRLPQNLPWPDGKPAGYLQADLADCERSIAVVGALVHFEWKTLVGLVSRVAKLYHSSIVAQVRAR